MCENWRFFLREATDEPSELFPPYLSPRRRREHGAAVDGIVPGLGRRGQGGKRRERGAGAPGRAVLGQRFPQQGMVGDGSGRDMELGQVLAPLADFRERMLFIRGLYNAEAQKGNIHSSQTGNLLSGAPLASGGEIRSGTSFDQLLRGPTASQPRCLAWCWPARSRTHRFTRTTRCCTARTFRGLRRRRRRRSSFTPHWPSIGCSETRSKRGDKSVLDAVLSDARDFRRAVSSADQRKLDEYLGLGARGRGTDRAGGPARRAAGLAAHTRASPTFRARPTGFLKTSASTCA